MSIGQIAIIELNATAAWARQFAGKGKYMNRLRKLREEKGYTQIKMQLLTGIDQSDYSKIENGKRYYTFEQCKRIAVALDTSMDYLAGLTDDPQPYPRKV